MISLVSTMFYYARIRVEGQKEWHGSRWLEVNASQKGLDGITYALKNAINANIAPPKTHLLILHIHASSYKINSTYMPLWKKVFNSDAHIWDIQQ